MSHYVSTKKIFLLFSQWCLFLSSAEELAEVEGIPLYFVYWRHDVPGGKWLQSELGWGCPAYIFLKKLKTILINNKNKPVNKKHI